MKKIKMTIATAMMAMVATAGYFGYSAYERATMTDQEKLILANIEALTRLEMEPVEITCSNAGCGDCYSQTDNLWIFICEWEGQPIYYCSC